MDAVVHLTSVEAKTTLASVRIAKVVAKWLDLPIIDSLEASQHFVATHGFPEKILLVNGPPAFCSWREALADLVKECDTLVFLQNDYTIYPPSQVNKVMRSRGWVNEKGHVKAPHVWGTIPYKFDECQSAHYVNWNELTLGTKTHWVDHTRRASGIVYFGAYRQGREECFQRYFNSRAPYPITVSASAQAGKKFAELNHDISVHKPWDNVVEALSEYRATIYCQDEYSNKHYTSPANRWYEGLAAGVAQFIDYESVDTLVHAGVSVDDSWIVMDHHDVNRRLRNWRRIAAAQQEENWKNPMSSMRRKVRKLYGDIK